MPIIPLGGQGHKLRRKGNKVLSRNGRPSECCCTKEDEPCATCESPNDSYEAAFADNVYFDYPGWDDGTAWDCEPDPIPPVNTGSWKDWDFTYTKREGYNPCEDKYWNGGTELKLPNGNRMLLAYIRAPDSTGWSNPCCYLLVFQVYICTGSTLNLVYVVYEKCSGTSPAGVYTFSAARSWAGLNLANLTRPSSITLT